MTWKDQYAERKSDSGLTWDEFVDQRLHHADELDDLRTDIQDLEQDVEQLNASVQKLYRELHDYNVLHGHE